MRGLARVGVVVRAALGSGDRVGAGDLADGGDDLGDGVLAGDRVVQHGGVQGPAVLALEDTGGLHDLAHGLEDAVRAAGTGQSAAEVGHQ